MGQHETPSSRDVATALTVKEAAERLGVHENTVRRWIDDGALSVLRIGPAGRTIRIRPEDLDGMVKAN